MKFVSIVILAVVIGGILLYDAIDRMPQPCEEMRREIEWEANDRYKRRYHEAVHAQFNLAVEILVMKGCLPTFQQGGHYRPSMRPAPRAFYTYVSRKERTRMVDWDGDGENDDPVFDGWTYTVREWNKPDGKTWEMEDHELGMLIACKGFRNPFDHSFGNNL